MALIRYHPSPPLDRYVDCLWWSSRTAPQAFSERMLPSGGAQIVFALHDAPVQWASDTSTQVHSWTGSIVHGPQWHFYVAGPKPAGAVVGIAIRPGAAAAVLGLPVGEIADRHVAMDMLWGTRARELREQLCAAADAPEAFRILEGFLLLRLVRPMLIHPAVAHALQPRASLWTATRVAQVQRESGYSPKHFIALFRAAVGMTPKHYYRVQRFAHVLKSLASPANAAGLADIAAAAGYADQAHLTREFRAFAGISPTQYRPLASVGPFHQPIERRDG